VKCRNPYPCVHRCNGDGLRARSLNLGWTVEDRREGTPGWLSGQPNLPRPEEPAKRR
jgi:hypothetical protein